MNTRPLHAWNVTPSQAIAIQAKLRQQVVTADDLGRVSLVAGVDVAYNRQNQTSQAVVEEERKGEGEEEWWAP
jgi:deoxyribonuclease V